MNKFILYDFHDTAIAYILEGHEKGTYISVLLYWNMTNLFSIQLKGTYMYSGGLSADRGFHTLAGICNSK